MTGDQIIILFFYLVGCILFFGFIAFAITGLSGDHMEDVMEADLAAWRERKRRVIENGYQITESDYWCSKCEDWHSKYTTIGARHKAFEVNEPFWLPEDELIAWRKHHSSGETPT